MVQNDNWNRSPHLENQVPSLSPPSHPHLFQFFYVFIISPFSHQSDFYHCFNGLLPTRFLRCSFRSKRDGSLLSLFGGACFIIIIIIIIHFFLNKNNFFVFFLVEFILFSTNEFLLPLSLSLFSLIFVFLASFRSLYCPCTEKLHKSKKRV